MAVPALKHGVLPCTTCASNAVQLRPSNATSFHFTPLSSGHHLSGQNGLLLSTGRGTLALEETSLLTKATNLATRSPRCELQSSSVDIAQDTSGGSRERKEAASLAEPRERSVSQPRPAAGMGRRRKVSQPQVPLTVKISFDRRNVKIEELAHLLAATGCSQSLLATQDRRSLPDHKRLQKALDNSTIVISMYIEGELPGDDYDLQPSTSSTTTMESGNGSSLSHEDQSRRGRGGLNVRPRFRQEGWLDKLLGGGREGKQRRLVGFARAVTDTTLVAGIYDIAVAPSLQGLGLGRRLVRTMARELDNRGIGDIAVTPSPELRRFFERCGFGPDQQGSTFMLLTNKSGLRPLTLPYPLKTPSVLRGRRQALDSSS